MPVYEYQCDHCKEQIEIIQKISDAPLTQCPICSGHLNKLISRSTFHLKGSGWYVTDYAKSDTPPPEKSDRSDEPDKPDKTVKPVVPKE